MMNPDRIKELAKISSTIRQLSIDAIERANSGHPGLPLGAAEIGAYLYGQALVHNPKNPNWMNRDRFVLSAGHGSMLLYSCLYLAGFGLNLDDIKDFRQLHSITPGHPEFGLTPGVEATTGPLGQGIGNAVGMALGMKILQDKFNTDEFTLFNNKIFTLAGDGCMLEGASSEASSLAGHLNLNNLVVIYDDNQITLDGPLSDSSSEDTKARYRSYGWEVYDVDGYDFEMLDKVFSHLRTGQKRPALVVARTIIGKGSPHKAGTSKSHGSPLGKEEALETKEALQISKEDFYVPQSVLAYFSQRMEKQRLLEANWNDTFRQWANANPVLAKEYRKMQEKQIPADLFEKIEKLQIASPKAGRAASHEVMNLLADELPFFYAGSADLATSDMTYLAKYPMITAEDFTGRNIKYGVREFAMGTITSGLALTQMFLPVCGTFMVFSDYMRNAIRVASLSSLQVVYQLTHDSVFIGEDGPTHQPVEHLASLRAMPRLLVMRPADNREVKMAWQAALNYKGPTALILSRQKLPDLKETQNVSYEEGFSKGAYIVKREKSEKIDFTLFSTGGELMLALEVAESLHRVGKSVRVVSFPCFELFDKQPQEYKDLIMGGDIGKRVSIEAGSDFGWGKYIGYDGISICVEDFGMSAPASSLYEELGFTVDAILQRLI